jgi:hypothetical protein
MARFDQPAEAGVSIKPGGVSPRVFVKGREARETGDSAATRFAGFEFFRIRSWGSRPRLYAYACFAG